jgi:predicted GIY-YIG superfamily endonuclease
MTLKRVGTVYLIHFEPPFRHAKHYLGYCDGPVEDRLARHNAGHGARLTRAAVRAGCRLVLARTWEGDRDRERQIHRWKCGPKNCPVCRARKKAG